MSIGATQREQKLRNTKQTNQRKDTETMTNTKTTKTKTNHLFRAMLTTLAMLAALLVASGAALASTTLSFGNHSSIEIADHGPANPYPSHTNVQNLVGTIIDVNVVLHGFRHNFADDVAVLLVGPRGQKVLLMSNAGGSHAINSTYVGFDDEAWPHLPDQNQIDGSTYYKPTQYGSPAILFPPPAPAVPYATSLSAFDGTNPNGTWDLYVLDDADRDVGQLSGGWDLIITTESSADTTPPRVTSTTPAAGATGVSPTANVSATFSEEMDVSTINGTTVQLFKKGSTTKLAADVFLGQVISTDGTVYKAILDPANSLQRGATYKAVVTTGAKDAAGNRLDQNSTLAGLQQKAWTFTVQN
jgi:subtilisin-like proprotein convertase family protein